jgi:twitching motility protein PilT
MKTPPESLKQLLDYSIEYGASDLHLIFGVPPQVRIDGKLKSVKNEETMTEARLEEYVPSLMTEVERDFYTKHRELDFSFGYKEFRFRANAYFQVNTMALALRLISNKIQSFSELGLPPIIEKFTSATQGLFIITGPTGHGKSTTLAAMIDTINESRSDHIVTIEDPIEYTFTPKKSIISQREVGSDTLSFARALRSVLREDPNDILVGEMRDLETIDAALTAAETGHLVLTTLHTASAAQTADRVIDVFPPYQQAQVRQQLASVLLGVVSQRLIPKANEGRIAAAEILIVTPAVRSLIREGKAHQLNNVISTSASEGMISLDKVLAELVSKGDITIDEALRWAIDAKTLKTLIY